VNRRTFLTLAGFGVPGFRLRTQKPKNPADPRNPDAATPNARPDAEPVIRVGFLRNGAYLIETIAVEAYVARVIAGEQARDSQPAALEALAITVRTFALANRGRHRADGFDLCDQTHCQVLRPSTTATERAARATAARVLLRAGAPAPVFFSASCGGHTEIPSAVWPGAEDPSYLPSREDDACQGAPAWSAELRNADLERALRSAGFHGDRLRDLRVVARNDSGRVTRLRVDGLQPAEISGQDLRVAVGRTLGWQHVKSTAFTLRRDGDAYRFTGHGSGHGVGLCVIGSARLAERGQSAETILARYFPGLRISQSIYSDYLPRVNSQSNRSDLLLRLPDEDEGDRGAIATLVTRARDELARTLGVGAPARLRLRFHATTDEYERATGQPWFTSGALVDDELHLLPLAVLRERGVLERTIRHELVHVMTNAALAGRPAWVREGAAIYFAGERPIPGELRQRPAFRPDVRASCPTDNELLRPVSVGALANAFGRAHACFAKQIESGRPWRDVR